MFVTCALAALLVVPVATGAVIYGPTLSISGQAKGNIVRVNLKVSNRMPQRGPAYTVTLLHCRFGQQYPFRLSSQTGHIDGKSGESLSVDKAGNVVWNFASLPPKGQGSRAISLPLVMPQKGGPFFCVRAVMHDPMTLKTVSLTLKVPLQ